MSLNTTPSNNQPIDYMCILRKCTPPSLLPSQHSLARCRGHSHSLLRIHIRFVIPPALHSYHAASCLLFLFSSRLSHIPQSLVLSLASFSVSLPPPTWADCLSFHLFIDFRVSFTTIDDIRVRISWHPRSQFPTKKERNRERISGR